MPFNLIKNSNFVISVEIFLKKNVKIKSLQKFIVKQLKKITDFSSKNNRIIREFEFLPLKIHYE